MSALDNFVAYIKSRGPGEPNAQAPGQVLQTSTMSEVPSPPPGSGGGSGGDGTGGDSGKPGGGGGSGSTGGSGTGGGPTATRQPPPPPDRGELRRRAAGDLETADARVAELDKQIRERRSGRVAVEDALAEALDSRGSKSSKGGYRNRDDEQLVKILEEESLQNERLRGVLETGESAEWVRLVRERRTAIEERQTIAKARRNSRNRERAAERARGRWDYSDPQSPVEPPRTEDPNDEMAKLKERADEFSGKMDELNKEFADIKDGKNKGQDESKLQEKLETLRQKKDALHEQAENIAEEVGTKLEGVKGSSPKEIFESLRTTVDGVSGAGRMLGKTLLNAYAALEGLDYILKADSLEEGVARSAEVAAQFVLGAVEYELMELIVKGGGPATIFTPMSSDSMGRERDQQEAQQRYQAVHTMDQRQKTLAVGKVLETHAPGSVMFVGGEKEYVIHDQKLWDETAKKYDRVWQQYQDQMEEIESQRGMAAHGGKPERDEKVLLQLARELGMKDGKTGKTTRMEEIQHWPEVVVLPLSNEGEMVVRQTRLNKLLSAYKEGFASTAPAPAAPTASGKISAGDMLERDNRAPLLERARALGLKDGKVGKNVRMGEIKEWPEVIVAGLSNESEIVTRRTLLNELLAAYRKSYDAAAPVAAVPTTLGARTAGELVEADKQADVLERARKLGLDDGKVGKPLHAEEMQHWREVEALQGPARATFFRRVLESYKEGFVSVAASKRGAGV